MSHNINSNFKLSPLYAALLVALAAPLPLAAQEQPAQDGAEQTLAPVSVYGEGENEYAAGVTSVGKTPTPIRDVPQSVTVINRAVLDAQGATSLTEALRNAPGITLSAGEGGQIGDNVNIRGYNARTDLFMDGMRDRGQYARETFFLEAVEVLRGPSSMLFGRGSTGGVINQVSKQASLRDHNEVGLGLGTEAFQRATVDVNKKFSDSGAFRVAALSHSNESTRDIVESERSGIAGSLRLGIDQQTEFALSVVIQRREDIPDYGFPFVPFNPPLDLGVVPENPAEPIDVDRDNFLGYTDDKFDQDVDVISMRIEHEFSPAVTLRNQTQSNTAKIHAMPTTISAFATAGNGRLMTNRCITRRI
jgi:catecholate siderophore receptor